MAEQIKCDRTKIRVLQYWKNQIEITIKVLTLVKKKAKLN